MTTGPAAPVLSHARWLPLGLAVVAGLTDVATFVLLGGVFSAHITGNLVVLAADAATGQPVRLVTVLAVPFFVLVAAAGTALVTRSARQPVRWVRPFLIAQTVLIAAATAVAVLGHASRHHTDPVTLWTGLLAVAAMAAQSTLLHVCVGGSPSTAAMTGNVVEATVSGVRVLLAGRAADQADREAWRRTWPLLVGFLAGCFVGALACYLVQDWGLLAAVLGAVAVAVLYRREGAD
jgi:uncharacterized membrane protein YoaK (UPF0700 family)